MSSVDVIVPCYNYGHYLRQCVESILTQEGVEVRVLVIDDASPDDSADMGEQLAREDSRVAFRRHRTNAGHIATYNEGIEWLEAEYMLLISADDYLLPGSLKRAADLLDRHPDMTLAFGKAVELYPEGRTGVLFTGRKEYDEAEVSVVDGAAFIEASGCRNLVPTPTAVVRTSLLKTTGGYRPELPHSGDMELWLRLAAHGSIGILGEGQAVYRRHNRNMSIAYCQRFLPDLEQRGAAIELFLEAAGDRLPDASGFRQRAFHELGRDAMWFGHQAFQAGLYDTSKELAALAARLCPPIRFESPWIKLKVKQIVGPRIVRALQPSAVAGTEN